MITYSKFGSSVRGNLGNSLFQYASVFGLSKKYNQELILPKWKYRYYFNKLINDGNKYFPKVAESSYHYNENDWLKLKNGSWDIDGWLQSEKYWEHSKEDIKNLLSWKEQFKQSVLTKFGDNNLENTIAISVRRGDYVDNPNYNLLPISYYIQGLINHFPDWQQKRILIFSDDIPYCKIHFECLPNVWFSDRLNDVEQLCLMSLCSGFIIANSTFSWWGAYLAELRDSDVKIVRPNYLFAGKLLEQYGGHKDHYPDRWINFDHKNKKYNLKNVTFTIPVSYDHQDRIQNVSLSTCLLQRVFDTNIVICEQIPIGGKKHFNFMQQWCEYKVFENNNFHRTKMLNDMAKEAKTPIVINWDADVNIPDLQIILAAEKIRQNQSDMVYPYDGRFSRVPRNKWFSILEKELDLGIFKNETFKGTNRENEQMSVGGAVMWNREKFIESGLENEHMVSYAPEDVERFERAQKLGYRVERIFGKLYHIDHWCGTNSSTKHKHYKNSQIELEKIRKMTSLELREYVDKWKWKK